MAVAQRGTLRSQSATSLKAAATATLKGAIGKDVASPAKTMLPRIPGARAPSPALDKDPIPGKSVRQPPAAASPPLRKAISEPRLPLRPTVFESIPEEPEDEEDMEREGEDVEPEETEQERQHYEAVERKLEAELERAIAELMKHIQPAKGNEGHEDLSSDARIRMAKLAPRMKELDARKRALMGR